MDPNLSQALHLINGSTVQSKIQSGGLLKQQLDAGIEPLEITKDLYLRCLSRQPNESELVDLKKHLDQGGEPLPALEDVFWALLNSQEFVFNH